MAYSRDGYINSLSPNDRAFFTIGLNTGVPILDQDWNLLQWNLLHILGSTFNNLVSFGWRIRGAFSNFGLNNFEMAHSRLMLNGFTLIVSDTEIVNANRIELETTTGRAAGDTYDIVFLEVWHEEVRDGDKIYAHGNVLHYDPDLYPNDLIDPDVGLLTCARLQYRYRIRAVGPVDGLDTIPNIMTMDPVTIQGKKSLPEPVGNPLFNFDQTEAGLPGDLDDYFIKLTTDFTSLGVYGDINNGEVFAFPIGLVRRVTGDDTVLEVTDIRPPARLNISDFVSPIVQALGEHTDTVLSSPSTGDIIYWNGSNWVNVDIGTLASGNLLLNDLLDVSATAASGRFLYYNGSQWASIVPTLNNLSDVNTTSPVLNSILRWNGSQWVDDDIAVVSGTSLALNDLSDVNTAGAVANVSYLRYDGSNWVDQPAVNSGLNLGTGSDIFSSVVSGTQMRFRSVLGSGLISVSQGTNEITVSTTAEVNDATNVGSGAGTIYTGSKTGDALQLKRIAAGSGITITNGGSDITISAAGGGGETNTGANVGSGAGTVFRDKTGTTLNFKKLQAGANITITNNANEIIIAAAAGGGAGSVGNTDLSTATGVVTASGSTTNVNITMNDYNFFPNTTSSGIFTDFGGGGETSMDSPAVYTYQTNYGSILSGTVARFKLLGGGSPGFPNPNFRCEWRYVT